MQNSLEFSSTVSESDCRVGVTSWVTLCGWLLQWWQWVIQTASGYGTCRWRSHLVTCPVTSQRHVVTALSPVRGALSYSGENASTSLSLTSPCPG